MKTVCIFGLGEAGSIISSDLLSAGISVQAYDPAPVITPAGVSRFEDPGEAVAGVDAVLALTAGPRTLPQHCHSPSSRYPKMHSMPIFLQVLRA